MTPQQFKEAREALSLTQCQLVAEWGMSETGERTIRRWEKGDSPINPIAAYCLGLMLRNATDGDCMADTPKGGE